MLLLWFQPFQQCLNAYNRSWNPKLILIAIPSIINLLNWTMFLRHEQCTDGHFSLILRGGAVTIETVYIIFRWMEFIIRKTLSIYDKSNIHRIALQILSMVIFEFWLLICWCITSQGDTVAWVRPKIKAITFPHQKSFTKYKSI